MRLCAAGFTSSQRNPHYCDSVVGRSILTSREFIGLDERGAGAPAWALRPAFQTDRITEVLKEISSQ